MKTNLHLFKEIKKQTKSIINKTKDRLYQKNSLLTSSFDLTESLFKLRDGNTIANN